MESKTLSMYERRRLENIKRNAEMIANLNLQHKANELSAAKRSRIEFKSYRSNPEKKKPKSETPIVIRRSRRSRGLSPDFSIPSISDDLFSSEELPEIDKSGPLTLREAWWGEKEDRKLVDTVMGMSENARLSSKNYMSPGYFKLGLLSLKQENIARIVPGRVLSFEFFPSWDRTVIAVGDKIGNVGFWDVGCREEGEGVYVYSPHAAPVSGISIQPFSLSKIFTSSYDGLIRLMDVEEEKFNIVCSSDDAVFSLSQQPNDTKSLYYGVAQGLLKVWDERAGKISSSFYLHAQRINTIDFNSGNSNLIATSSSDGSACIWDLRSVNANKPKCLRMVEHNRAVHSAYFSPSGSSLATTSFDDKVGLVGGVNFIDTAMIGHQNQTSRWISTLRAIWGWDDSYLFIGNTKRAVDVISTIDRPTRSLESPLMTAIPCRLATHPYKVGILAGATGGGQVYMWTTTEMKRI